MSSSNLAERIELATPDLLSEPPRLVLQVITNTAPLVAQRSRPRVSMETRAIVIRDHGFRFFRVY